MKRLFIAIVSVLVPMSLSAQIEYKNMSADFNKRKVDVSFDIISGEKTLKNNLKMVLTPYLHNGADTLWFDEVEVYGSRKYRRERQEQHLDGNKGWTLGEGQIFEGDSYAYSASTPYQSWFKGATLSVDRRVVGCNCDCYDGSEDLTSIAPYNPPAAIRDANDMASRYEVAEPRKRWIFDEKQMRVIYPVSIMTLYPEKYDNQRVLDQIMDALKRIAATDEQRLNSIEIKGFASPEGALDFNTELGEGRANALREYIISQMPSLRPEQFELVNGVENWEGLREMVVASDMESKSEVLKVLDSDMGDARKQALKTIDGGKAYRYMLENFYPPLRNACYIAVYYDELDDFAADAINRANALIRGGKYAEALELLQKYQSDERAWNSIGVCMMHQERFDEAINWLEKAAKSGSEEAKRNLSYLK